MPVGTIDLREYPSPEQLAAPLFAQASELGFVYLKGADQLTSQAHELFDLGEHFFHEETAQAKEECAITTANKGYAAFAQESLDPSKPGDAKELINIGLIRQGEAQQQLPPILQARIDQLERFQRACHALCQLLLDAFAMALKLSQNHFSSQHSYEGDNPTILRLLRYPPGHSARAGAHSDYGSVTLLFQRKIGGLQVLPPTESPTNEEAWMDVDVLENAILVNIGDALERVFGFITHNQTHKAAGSGPAGASNQRCTEVCTLLQRSHLFYTEAVTAAADTADKERFSIAVFNHPTNDAMLENVLPDFAGVTDADLERLERKGVERHARISSFAHLQARLKATYHHRNDEK